MKKKKPKQKHVVVYAENERALRELYHMKHRDLQKACIVRGLGFNDVVGKGHQWLALWFQENYDNGQDETLLTQFDAWRHRELNEKFGDKLEDWQKHPALNYGYTGNVDQLEKPRSVPKLTQAKPDKKQKAKIDEATGVRTGTKKALTYQLTLEGKLKVDKIIEQVMNTFPDAQEKSIRIWHKRALKENPAK